MRHIATALFPLALAACGGGAEAPWVTDPGIDGHAVYLPLRGTVHDPSGAASATSCEGCHPGSTFSEFVCTGCHTPALTDPNHSGVTGYSSPATSADCYRCHPQGAGIAPADHGRFFPIGTAAHPPNCGMCHTDPAARGDPAKLACGTCHAGQPGFATAHQGVLDYTSVTTTATWCLRCHADGQVDRVADHGRRAGPPGSEGSAGPGDGRHAAHCFTCHTMVPPLFGGPAPGVADRPWAQDWQQSSCSACH